MNREDCGAGTIAIFLERSVKVTEKFVQNCWPADFEWVTGTLELGKDAGFAGLKVRVHSDLPLGGMWP